MRAERPAESPEEGEKWAFYDEYPYVTDGGFEVNRVRRAIYRYDSAAEELTCLTAEEMQTYDTYFSGDVLLTDRGFYYTGHPYTRWYESTCGLYFYDYEAGESRLIWEALGEIHAMYRFGGRIVLSVFFKGEPMGHTGAVTISEEDPADVRIVDADWQFQLGAVRGDAFWYCRNEQAEQHLFRAQAGGEGERVDTREVSVTSLGPLEEGILWIGYRPWEPAEVWFLKDGGLQQLSAHGKALTEGVSLSRGTRLEAENEGHCIEGWVMPPVGHEPGRKYPAVVNVHGGPHGYFGRSVHYDNQWLCGEGYFVILCNPTGSTSYGREFADISGEMGGRDLRDILAFTDAACGAFPDIDPARIAITGQSYGGYMSNMAVGKTDRFRAAVSRMGISNWFSMFGTAIDSGYTEGCVGGDPWSAPEKLWEQSPLKYVRNVRTPILLMQHQNDRCCPLEQAEQFFTELCRMGVPSRLMVNRGCGHGGRAVSQLVHDMEAMLEWFRKYL